MSHDRARGEGMSDDRAIGEGMSDGRGEGISLSLSLSLNEYNSDYCISFLIGDIIINQIFLSLSKIIIK